jgi:hypothetical protein
MGIGTNPWAPVSSGLGGVVRVPTYFWVDGYGGEVLESPIGVATVTNCVVDGDHLSPQVEVHTVQIRYRGDRQPIWSFGDGESGPQGWGGPGGGSVSHTYQVSSGRCPGPPGCLDVPLKGPSYVVMFSLTLTVELVVDGVPAPRPFTTDRARAYPVREIQSILEH